MADDTSKKLPASKARPVIAVRAPLELKERLEASANESGRSIGQEIEQRLNASFAQVQSLDDKDPTSALFHTLRRCIEILESQTKTEWWNDGNSSTILEGAIIETVRGLVRPTEEQKLYSNNLFRPQEADDPKAQQRLREMYLSDGAAIARLSMREALDFRMSALVAKAKAEADPSDPEPPAANKRRKPV